MKDLAATSPRLIARVSGLVYVMVFVTGIFALVSRSKLGVASGLVAALLYTVVTALFCFIFRPAGRKLSLLAAIISFVGIVIGPLSFVVKAAALINPLVFFGFYCSLIAVLIFKSTFLPRFLSVLMAIAGCGWFTFTWPSFALSLAPYIYLPGAIGEGALTLWLVVFGVNERQWKQQLAHHLRREPRCH